VIISTRRVMLDRTTRRSMIAIGHGVDAETGDEVTFTADFASMVPVTNAMARGEVVDCYVEPWQVLSRQPARMPANAPTGTLAFVPLRNGL
jgi:hypothetical protein